MKVITTSEEASSVKDALKKAAETTNERLANLPGQISRIKAEIDAGMSGGTAKVTVAVDEERVARKHLLWANEAGNNKSSALERAEKRINEKMEGVQGEIAGFYQKLISPPIPSRVYASLIVAVNKQPEEKVDDLTSAERRERLASALHILGNDPRSVNVTRLAELFDVSRDTIYRDLRAIGADR